MTSLRRSATRLCAPILFDVLLVACSSSPSTDPPPDRAAMDRTIAHFDRQFLRG